MLIALALLAALAAWAGTETTATGGTPHTSGQTPHVSGPGEITLLPGTVPVDEEVKGAVRQALIQAQGVVGTAAYYAISDVQAKGDWRFVSVVGLEGLDPSMEWNLLDHASWYGLILLRGEVGGLWAGAVEGTAAFSRLLAGVPDAVLAGKARQALDPLQGPVAPASSYRFPWEPGTSMVYGALGVHEAGFPSVVQNWKAVDFVSDGNTSVGHAPNRLLAAAAGTLSYICRDGTSVAIRVGDLLYVHLLDHSGLTIGRTYDPGEEIGPLRPGSFSDRCGWASQGGGWFHVHWGFPNTPTFSAGGWTLDLGDGLWRRGDETRGTGAWFEAEGGSPPPCPAPQLTTPPNVYLDSGDWTIHLGWEDVDCDHDGYRLRVKTVPNMESGGETVLDSAEESTGRTLDLDPQWEERDLYWSVRAADAPGGAAWAWARMFRVSLNHPPEISFETANGEGLPPDGIASRDGDWVFQGTASDPEGHLNRIEYACAGDDCGSLASQSGLDLWTYERHGLRGRNDIHFRAYDDEGHLARSQYLDLRIDGSPPATGHELEGTRGKSDWYTSAVTVHVHAADGSTGRARAGVSGVYYRIDGGDWHTDDGADVFLTVSGDGTHTVEYYAVDRVGNVEESQAITAAIDVTPPGAPGTITETHGVPSGEWQSGENDPAFAWSPAGDAASEVWYYRVTWNGQLEVTTGTTYDPPPVPSGSYEISVQVVDRAGNVGPAGEPYLYRTDGTPPHAPEIVNVDGVASGVPQTQTRTAHFWWPTPDDEGSGVVGYHVYWGPDEMGTSDTLITSTTFLDSTPICGPEEVATYTLRVRSQDGAGLRSQWVNYVLRYDGTPPTATLSIQNGLFAGQRADVQRDFDVSYTNLSGFLADDAPEWVSLLPPLPSTSQMLLDPAPPGYPSYGLSVQDGVRFTISPQITLTLHGPDAVEVQLSHDSAFSTTWQPYTTTIPWTLEHTADPTVPHSVYARFRDSSGILHGDFRADILYDPDAPEGAIGLDPSDFLTGTHAASPGMAAAVTDGHPIVLYLSARDEASGLSEVQIGEDASLDGATWRPYTAVVTETLSGGDGLKTVYARYRDRAGNPSATAARSTLVDTTPPTGTVSIFPDVVGEDTISVTLWLSATDETSGVDGARVSARTDFTEALWQPYSPQVAAPVYPTGVEGQVLYIQFRDRAGNVSTVYSTTYTVDRTPPSLEVQVAPCDTLTCTVTVRAGDGSEDLDWLWLTNDPWMADGAVSMPYTATVTWAFDERRVVWVQARDRAGNLSERYAAYAPELRRVYVPIVLRAEDRHVGIRALPVNRLSAGD